MAPSLNRKLVKPCRDEFGVSEIGIVHKPTEYTFVPHPGKPSTGVIRRGMLGRALPDGREYDVDAVAAMSGKIWAAFLLKGEK